MVCTASGIDPFLVLQQLARLLGLFHTLADRTAQLLLRCAAASQFMHCQRPLWCAVLQLSLDLTSFA